MKTCIIIVNWNNAKDTTECLKSLQNIDDIDIVVVDNGSSDDSIDILKNCGYNIKIIESDENLGYGGGNNLAIRYAIDYNYKYVWLLNNDTIVLKNSLDELLKEIEDGDKGIVGSRLIYLDHPISNKIQALAGGSLNTITMSSKHITNLSDVSRLDYVSGASMLIRIDVIRDIGMFDERIFLYWEDVDLCLRAYRGGWKLGLAYNSIVYHKESATSSKLGVVRQKYFTQGLYVMMSNNFVLYRIRFVISNLLRITNKLLRGNIKEAEIIFQYGVWKIYG